MAATLAEPGQRLLARIVDTLIIGLPVILIVRELVSGHTVDIVAPPAIAGCMLLYEAIQLAVWGRTLGKRFAGIEVIVAVPQENGGAALQGAESAPAPGDGHGEPGAESAPEEDTEGDGGSGAEAGGDSGGEAVTVPVGERTGLGVLRAVLRASVYSLPIVVRPIPVLGALAGLFWVVNAGVLYEGAHRQAGHDRLAGTLVVKSPRPDSSAF